MSKTLPLERPVKDARKPAGKYFTHYGWALYVTEKAFQDAVDKHFDEDDGKARLIASIILEELKKGAAA